ncbi:hypothetical protein [Rhizobium sp. SU303]|uniref:hypothetical protein n=1 Tax=Rhizobium sp. SU303 TaxID=3138065 RepID=UPI001E4D370A|nr:hypothetical protein [Rhizobium leguminosarum]UFW80048.1 hypothetical protein RlegSU303_09050 [Rhizobium leguminosarum bv. viciae]
MDRIPFIIEQLKEARHIAADNPGGEMVVYLLDIAIVEAEEEQRRRSDQDEEEG